MDFSDNNDVLWTKHSMVFWSESEITFWFCRFPVPIVSFLSTNARGLSFKRRIETQHKTLFSAVFTVTFVPWSFFRRFSIGFDSIRDYFKLRILVPWAWEQTTTVEGCITLFSINLLIKNKLLVRYYLLLDCFLATSWGKCSYSSGEERTSLPL